jgi:hypothetical protein
MGRRKTDKFEDEDYFDETEYDKEDIGLNLDSDFEEDFEGPRSSILEDISIADIVNEYGIDGFSDAIIESISYSDLERLRDRINEYLE